MISDTLALIFLIGGMQGIMLTLALIRLANKPPALNYLIVLIGLVSIDLLGQLIYWQALFRSWPHLLGVFSFLPASYGPLFYLYVKGLLRPGALWEHKNLWMFIPFACCYLINLPIIFASAEAKIAMVDNIPINGMPITLVMGGIIQLSSLLFVLAAMLRLWRDRHIGIRSAWLDWVLIMAIFQVVIWGVVIVNLLSPVRLLVDGAPYLVVSAMIYVLGYKSLFSSRAKASQFGQALETVPPGNKRPAMEPVEKGQQRAPQPTDEPEGKYGNQRLDDDTLQQLWQQLAATLQQDRLYTQPNLKIADLANRTGLAVHLVSQVINATQARNFNELVNDMRIAEACRLLGEHSNLTVQAVMESAGFQAKSTFNTLFKQATGQTPSQYRKSL